MFLSKEWVRKLKKMEELGTTPIATTEKKVYEPADKPLTPERAEQIIDEVMRAKRLPNGKYEGQ